MYGWDAGTASRSRSLTLGTGSDFPEIPSSLTSHPDTGYEPSRLNNVLSNYS